MLGIDIFLLFVLIACIINQREDKHEPWCPWEKNNG